jgi:hypothetical protein
MVKNIDAALYDWVEWNTRLLENSGIGFQTQTSESRMAETRDAFHHQTRQAPVYRS